MGNLTLVTEKRDLNTAFGTAKRINSSYLLEFDESIVKNVEDSAEKIWRGPNGISAICKEVGPDKVQLLGWQETNLTYAKELKRIQSKCSEKFGKEFAEYVGRRARKYKYQFVIIELSKDIFLVSPGRAYASIEYHLIEKASFDLDLDFDQFLTFKIPRFEDLIPKETEIYDSELPKTKMTGDIMKNVIRDLFNGRNRITVKDLNSYHLCGARALYKYVVVRDGLI